MAFQSYKEESKKGYGISEYDGSGMHIDKLMLGCAQRSAEALEAMAKPYTDLIKKVTSQEETIQGLHKSLRSMELSNIAYRAWITRLKNQLHKQILQG